MTALTDPRLQQRDHLLRIARALTARLDLHEVLALVIRYAVEITNGRAGAIAMRQADGRLKVMAEYGLEERYRDELGPLLERARQFAPGGLQELSDPSPATTLLRESSAAELGQVLAIPLSMYDQTTGVLFVFRSEAAAVFTPIDTQLLAAFASQAAVAIQNANLYADIAVQAAELRNLYDFSVDLLRAYDRESALAIAADYALVASSADWLALLCREDERGEYGLRVTRGMAALQFDDDAVGAFEKPSNRLLQDKVPLVLEDAGDHENVPDWFRAAGLRAVVGVPVCAASRDFGVLWAGKEAHAFHESDVRLLVTFVQYLGLALDKFSLLEQIAARERQLAAIVEHSPTGILLLDKETRVISQNQVLLNLVGSTATTIAGVHLNELLQLETEAGQRLPAALPSRGESEIVQGYIRRQDNTRGPFVQVTINPLADEGGEVEGFVANVADLTAFRENESAKSAFLAGLSHELKTPLALIRGFAETLRYPQVHHDEKLYHESLDVILTETAHLTEMVNQLLLAARLQARALDLDLDEIALDRLLLQLVDEFRQTYPEYDWRVDIDEALPVITADVTHLRSVFTNLLSNAVKYSDPGSPVWVAAAPSVGGVRISVRDEGIGIAPEDQDHLFRRFFRASDRGDGTGLGLYMSKAMVEAHGGTIRVDSQPGKGSVFVVELPSVQPAP